MKAHFSRWYSSEVKEALDQGLEVADVKIDLRASIVKPLHGNWLMTTLILQGKERFDPERIRNFF